MTNETTSIKFNAHGLVPAIAQDAATGEVLMMAWMNAESLQKTLETKKAHYFSRSRNSLWLKGETSGNFQEVKSIQYDCDADTLLLMIEPRGPACHTGERSCFYRTFGAPAAPHAGPFVISELARVLEQRKDADPKSSYAASLYAKGLPRILAKVEEETAELVEAASDKDNGQVVYEFCDLLFHSMALLAHKGIDIEEVFAELKRRSGTSGIQEKNSREKK